MRGYQHLSLKERIRIFHLLKTGLSLRKIAQKLNRSLSTMSREVRRLKKGFYAPGLAQKQYERKKSFLRERKISSNSRLYQYIHRHLKESWSPEQISGRLRYLKKPFYVCHESIYQFIYRNNKTSNWYKYLAKSKLYRGKRLGRKQGSGKYNFIPSIEQRGEIKGKFGHWEGDTMAFSPSRYHNITTLLEVKSKVLILIKNFSRKSEEVMSKIKKKLEGLRRKKDCLSLTLDQGSELTPSFLATNDVHWETYYCHSHSPWERGANENMNGRLRRERPRSFDITKMTQEELEILSRKYNRTPRKILGYRTPNEVWRQS